MRGTMKSWMLKPQAIKPWVIAISLALGAECADAAGFGRINVSSTVGQPLTAEIDLVNVTPEDLQGMSAKIASPEMFREANVDRSPILDSVKLTIEKRENGQPFIKVSSAQAIAQPALNLLVEVNWASGRLVRDYPLLLNPPKSSPSAAGAGAVSPPGFVSQPAPAVVAEAKEKEAAAAPPPPPAAPTKPAAVAAPQPAPAPVAPAPVSPPPAVVAQESPREESSLPPPSLPAGTTAPDTANASMKVAQKSDKQVPPKKTIKVKSGDTLTTITAKLHPPKGMLEQTMIAVFEANRQAFIKDNVNRIRSGASLQIPDAEAVAAIRPEDANKRLKLMAKDFDAYRSRLASASAARPVAEAPSRAPVTGKMEGAADDAATPVKPGANDVLKLSRSGENKKAEKIARAEEPKSEKPSEKEKAAEKGKTNSAVEDKLREEAVVRENQLKEARERASILEKDVGQMRKLLQEKEALAQQLQLANAKKAEEEKKEKAAAAKLIAPPVALPETIKSSLTEEQKEAARKESSAKKAADEKPAGETTKSAESASTSKMPEGPSTPPAEADSAEKAAKEAKEAQEADEAKKAETKEEEKPVSPLGRPEKKPAAVVPAEPDTAWSMLSEHPLAIAGGLISGVLIGWLGLAALRRRRERQQDALFEPDPIDPVSHSTVAPSNPEPDTPKTAAVAETIKDFMDGDEGNDEETSAILRQDVDPIEEADVYIAYGRNEQAEEILLKAIVANPSRLELLKKLLDLYAMQKRLADYAQGFTKLQSLAPAGSTLLGAARRMGAEIDPPNPLYSVVAAAPVPPPAPAAPAAPAGVAASLSGVDLDVTRGPAPASAPAPAPSTPASALVPPVPGESSAAPQSFADIDLDMDEPAETPPAERGPEWQAVATQLDLARAYMEIEDKDNARDLLNEVVEKGDAAQRAEAERILAELGG